jgi:multidrug efflux system membrane fusion protein
VQRGPNGTFVYVAQPDNKVAVRPVTVSQQDEVQSVIAKGVDANERVVTTGFARLAPGSAVTVTNAESAPAPDAQPVEPPRRRRGGDGNGGGRRNRGEQRSSTTSNAGQSAQR